MRNRAGLLLVAARANLLSGQVQGHRDGFGFLIRDDAGADLVLSEHEMSKVLHGDRVLARITGADRRGRPEGEIVEVIESRTNKLVGRLLNERGVPWWLRRRTSASRTTSWCRPARRWSAEPGQVVVVEILQQPQRYVQPVGRVIEVLGAIDDPGMEIEIAVRKFAVPHEFPDAARADWPNRCPIRCRRRICEAESICATCRWSRSTARTRATSTTRCTASPWCQAGGRVDETRAGG